MAEPYYRRVMEDIRLRIASGELEPGERLPFTDELIDYYRLKLEAPSLSRQPIRRAIEALIEAGVLRGQQGLGVFVADGRPA